MSDTITQQKAGSPAGRVMAMTHASAAVTATSRAHFGLPEVLKVYAAHTPNDNELFGCGGCNFPLYLQKEMVP